MINYAVNDCRSVGELFFHVFPSICTTIVVDFQTRASFHVEEEINNYNNNNPKKTRTTTNEMQEIYQQQQTTTMIKRSGLEQSEEA